MKILKSKQTKTAKKIESIFETTEGSFLLKTRLMSDNTAEARFYKVSFDGLGDILCEETYGKVLTEAINKNNLLAIHDRAFSKVLESYTTFTAA